MQYTTLESQAEGRTLPYGLYLPPKWDGTAALPLVLLLHGSGDDETSADRRRTVEALDRAIVRGAIPPFAMVTPRGERGFWVNWHDGSHRYRDFVLDEVVPDVRARYPMLGGGLGLHLVGVSMGGGGGLQMWLAAPERFASATILSAPVLDEASTRSFLDRFVSPAIVTRVFGPPGSASGIDPYQALRAPADLGGTTLVFGSAQADYAPIVASNTRFEHHLKAAAIPHARLQFPGRHGWKAWSRAIPAALCLQLSPRCTPQILHGLLEDSRAPRPN